MRNRRGEGGRLREEIIAAATTLLERTGSEDSITLRGVAREAGVAAPSIYAHFADRDEIVNAVVARAFAELDEALAGAGGLRGLCEAYLTFAAERPHRYRVAFQRYGTTRPPERLSGMRAFDRLADAVAAAGRRSPRLDATVLWAGLHGYAALRASVPAFPWPSRAEMLDGLLKDR
jgi:AcrR family transcriptional regulator